MKVYARVVTTCGVFHVPESGGGAPGRSEWAEEVYRSITNEHAVEACGCNSIGGLPAPEPLSGEVVTEPTIFAPGTVLRVVGVVL